MFHILAIGDQHFTTKNMKNIETFIEAIQNIANERKPDAIVLLGDLLHTHENIHQAPLNKACEFIKKMRDIALTFVLVGNHDYLNNSQFLSDHHWLNCLKEWENVVIVDKITYHKTEDDTLLAFSPYVEPDRFVEALNTCTDYDWKDASLIFCHQEFFGCNMNDEKISDRGKWDLNYPQVISGHIHTKQHVQRNIYYPGSSMETEWKDTNKIASGTSYNSIAFITLDKESEKGHLIEEIEIHLHRKIKIHLDISEFESFVIPEVRDDTLKILITGIPYEEFNTLKNSAKFKELIKNDINVDFGFNKKEIKVNNAKLQAIINDSNLNNFRSIFDSIAQQQRDPVYHEIYQFIMNDRVIKADDILILGSS